MRVHLRRNMPEFSLNITALMDVLTVLLFFLIKNLSIDTTSMNIPKDIRLPSSMSHAPVSDAPVVSLSANELKLGDQLISQLKDGKFAASEIGSDGRTLNRLYKILESEFKKRNQVYSGAGNLSFLPDAEIAIQGDKSLPFSTVRHVLHTAAKAGYTQYRFVVQDQSDN